MKEECNNEPGLKSIHLINMNNIRQYVRTDGGYVIMDDGATVSVARNRKDDFLDLFSKF